MSSTLQNISSLAQWVDVTNVELLHSLASAYGFGTSYRASNGAMTTPPPESFISLLQALGVNISDAPSDEELHHLIHARHQYWATRPLPPCVVATAGQERHFNVHVHDGHPAHTWIQLEDGTPRETYQDENWAPPTADVAGVVWGEATFHVPGNLPPGYHTLHLESDNFKDSCPLLVVPARLESNQRYIDNPVFGVMAQLYSVRSEQSWGIGDFEDLGTLAVLLAEQGADYLLINPVHAAQPIPPVEDSPYLPTSRRFVNPIYISVEAVDEYYKLDKDAKAQIERMVAPLKALNRSAEPLRRNEIFETKLAVLRELFFIACADERRTHDFELFCLDEGEGLEEFARWCAVKAMETAPSRHELDEELEELTRFYMWLQFIADEQRRRAQDKALAAGMKVGIMTDLAVGIHPDGADANTLANVLVPEASVGAPPDQYSQQGQDWSQPPWHPQALAEAGYEPWRELLRTVLRHSGGIRVDHILGLFRLFWMPRNVSPMFGTYMNYDHEAMVGTLVLEAQRANAVVVGEDLGTFEPWVQDVLQDKGILGTTVLWFESYDDGSPLHTWDYRRLALSAVGTHDLPPTAGYLRFAHNILRDELGLIEEPLEELNEQDHQWQARVLDRVREDGHFHGTSLEHTEFTQLSAEEFARDVDVEDLLVGLTRFIAATPSAMTVTNLVDMVGDTRIQNQPGTNAEQYSNWCIPLTDNNGKAVLIEDLPSIELFGRVAEASKR